MTSLIKKLALIFVLTINITVLMGCHNAIPSDKELEENFYKNRKGYELLAKDVLKQADITRIELKTGGRLQVTGSMDENKSKLYKQLFNKLSIALVDVSFKKGTYDEIAGISFYHYLAGFVFGGDDKGVVYLVGASPVTVASLDVYGKENSNFPPSGVRIYKKLAHQWYLFYEYFD